METFIRKCPKCGKDVQHKTQTSCRQGEKRESSCLACRNQSYSEKFKGSNNPFFGKTHTEATKEKIRNRDKSFFNTVEYKQKVSKQCKGKGNPMYGKTYYQVWVQKYGKEKADQLQKTKNEKTSKQCKGKGNPMFGKPSPQGSGNGWSGWYKGWYFRSLRELSYVVNVLEYRGDDWECAESIGIKIPYTDWKGNTRNYIPDFLVNSVLLVEIKPARLKSSVTVRAKKEAAELFVKQHDWKYVLIDPPVLNKEQIKELHDKKILKFIDRYEKKYIAMYE